MIQLFQILLRRRLQIVNCHANTDTSDILVGLRPLRGRSSILLLIIEYVQQLEQTATSIGALNNVEMPPFEGMNAVDTLNQDKLVHKVMDYANRSNQP